MSKSGKRYKSKTNNKIVLIILMFFFIGLFIFSGIKILNYIKDEKSNNKIFDEISDLIVVEEKTAENNENTENKYKIDFASLKQKNSDTVGLLKVGGTDIEQVVVQAKDNNFYLRKNFNKEYNVAGWPFVDYQNKLDGTDKNIIIYGHNMKNGTMFSSLKNILTEEWFNNENNRNVTFITENGTTNYKVFSVYQIEEEDYYIKTGFRNNEFEKFVNTMKKRSKFDFNVQTNNINNILTLSTCGNTNKYRIVLQAYI